MIAESAADFVKDTVSENTNNGERGYLQYECDDDRVEMLLVSRNLRSQ
jgi:hypothetical protein